MFAHIMSTNRRRLPFVSINAPAEPAASATNKSCIAQVTLKLTNQAPPVNSGWPEPPNPKAPAEPPADEHGLNCGLDFELTSVRRFFTILAEA